MPQEDGVHPHRAVVGIDVGGTRIKAVLTDASGAVLADEVRPTPPAPGAGIGGITAEIVHRLSAARPDVRLGAVGVVVPGLVDDSRGVGIWSANLGWRDLPLREIVTAHVGLPVAAGHDVRAGLLAEHRLGAARGVDDVLFLPLGTGIASAQLSGGSVVAASPWTGEIGHVVAVVGGRPCGCGARGCLEAEVSAVALGRRWAEIVGEGVDAADLAQAVRQGDERATALWMEAIGVLAQVLAPSIAAAGTRLLLVGGGLIGAGAVLLDPLRAGIAARLPGREDLDTRVAALGDRAGALGAAVLALDLLESGR